VSTEPPASPEASKESLVGTVEGRPAGPPAIGAHGLADSAQPAREGAQDVDLTSTHRASHRQMACHGLAVDPKRWPAARLDGVESRHPPTERPGRKARCGRRQLTRSVVWPQGWMPWKADTRRLKNLAARQGMDVGS